LKAALKAIDHAGGAAASLSGLVATIAGKRSKARPSGELTPINRRYDQFLLEATVPDGRPDAALGPDSFYGLYISWCLLNQVAPRPPRAFWAAMRIRGISPGRNRLGMKGPAAADYILASSLCWLEP
jgi:hypothetical protein